MQLVIRDKRSVDLIVKESPTYDSHIFLPHSSKLFTEIMERPPNSDTPARRINMISQHVSGRAYTASIYDRNSFRESHGIRKLRALLERTMRMYKQGKLIGDLVFHKTSHGGCQYDDQTWPIKVADSSNKPEHWYLTGALNWVYRYRDNLNYTTAPEVYSIRSDDVDEYKRYMIEVARADSYQANKVCNYNFREHSGRYIQRMQRYMQRLELLNVLRDKANVVDAWDDYMIDFEVFRFGAFCYKNGKIYYYIGGSSPSHHHIQLHANRNNTLGGIF